MTSQGHLVIMIGVVALTAAYQTQSGWLFVLGAVCLALVASGWALAAWNLRRVVLVDLPVQPVFQGTPVALRVSVTCPTGVACGVQVMRPLDPTKAPPYWWWRGMLVPAGWASRAFALVDARTETAVTMPVATPKRGEFTAGGWWVQCAFPLGLVAVLRPQPSAPVGMPVKYLVFPVAPRLGGAPWLEAADISRENLARVAPGHGTLLRGVREYRSGDPARLMHWKTTARRGTPHVKETEREVGEALVIYLDMRAAMHTEETVEHAVTIATALYQYLLAQGRQVRLACQAEAEPDDGGHHGAPGLAWLARVQATATGDACQGPAGSILIAPAYVPGWQGWASHFVYCPGAPGNRLDASAYCPVGADIPTALGEGAAE